MDDGRTCIGIKKGCWNCYYILWWMHLYWYQERLLKLLLHSLMDALVLVSRKVAETVTTFSDGRTCIGIKKGCWNCYYILWWTHLYWYQERLLKLLLHSLMDALVLVSRKVAETVTTFFDGRTCIGIKKGCWNCYYILWWTHLYWYQERLLKLLLHSLMDALVLVSRKVAETVTTFSDGCIIMFNVK